MSYLTDKNFNKGPGGFSSSKKDLAYWEDRAEQNSLTATRAKGGKVPVHDTGGKVSNRSTSSPPKGFKGDPYAKAHGNTNHAGDSSYMRGIRRIGQ
jgi:hypothetical protein